VIIDMPSEQPVSLKVVALSAAEAHWAPRS
jgi:hypothetical protein